MNKNKFPGHSLCIMMHKALFSLSCECRECIKVTDVIECVRRSIHLTMTDFSTVHKKKVDPDCITSSRISFQRLIYVNNTKSNISTGKAANKFLFHTHFS